ncbi:MAG: hypothetical protein CVU56_24240 [Deltaproteobacteria bacterium HGW-Deltaproteobacteria-14]|jgi:GNAT superfamily N-acetyltransferase|nr:MAG: hypothetical protein CVU56_24240 [Deltaproteobacteria bacterium HGW-Deltaproteobacteria-14]
MLTTRLATLADYADCARLFPELGVPDPVFTAEQFATRLLPRVVVAEADGRTVGYASWRLYGLTAHVVHVVADPAARRRGVGRALVGAVREHVADAGCSRWYLNVKRNNAVAIRLYQRAGMTVELESTSVQLPWAKVEELPRPAGPIGAFAPSPADDAAIAARFAIPVERVTAQRTRPGYVAAGVREGGVVAAFATFDPDYPGAYPFCATRPDLARPLLEALQPHALPDRGETLFVSVEGNAPLAGVLVDAGARVLFELYRMSAPL